MICSLRATLIAVMYMLKFHEKCVWHCRDLVLGGHYSSDGKSVGDGIPRSRVRFSVVAFELPSQSPPSTKTVNEIDCEDTVDLRLLCCEESKNLNQEIILRIKSHLGCSPWQVGCLSTVHVFCL